MGVGIGLGDEGVGWGWDRGLVLSAYSDIRS